jgi:hypothetical protein
LNDEKVLSNGLQPSTLIEDAGIQDVVSEGRVSIIADFKELYAFFY